MTIPSNGFRAEDCTDARYFAQDVVQPAQHFAQMAHNSAHSSTHILDAEIVEARGEGGIPHGAPYGSSELAEELQVAESTLRTRWLPWIRRVAPDELLLVGKEYTELARSLFTEFAQVPRKKTERERWVSDAKQRYSREFMPGGITPEGVPDELGGALALLRQQGSAIQTAADVQMADIKQLIVRQAGVEAEFDEADVEAMKAAGMKRGVMRYQIETTAEDSTYYQLRKLRSEARGGQAKAQDA